jgi:integrase
LTLRQLTDEFLADRRKARGRRTAQDYAARLGPVLDFAEKGANLKRWPLAGDVDDEFASSLRAFLFEYRTTRNGGVGGTQRPLSPRQVINVLECLRTMLHWARKPQVRKLPRDWASPLTAELIGQPPAKDPLREDKLTLETRATIVKQMDVWQVCVFGLSVVLPLRPDEAAGLLIGDVNFQRGWLEFGRRFADCNFTKGKVAFVLPFPDELRPVLAACVGGRAEGPLLRSRKSFGRAAQPVSSAEHLRRLYEAELSRQPAGAVQTEQDRKEVFRQLLRRLGGVSEDALSREFKGLVEQGDIRNGATLYSLRHSVTTAMNRAGVPHLELRYVTGHSANDILNEYASLDPVAAMRRYFDSVRPLLGAVAAHSARLGLT